MPTSSQLRDRLETLHDELSPLKHRFYTRWTEGTLTREELADYAGQYRHAVTALADASDAAAAARPDDLELAAHAREERAHVSLWDGFARAFEADDPVAAHEGTEICVSAWAGDDERSLLRTVAALHAIESPQPAIAATKRDGLVERYGVAPRSEGTRYFDLHAVRDVAHAEQAWQLLDQLVETPADEDAVVAEAEAVLRGYLGLLDDVTRDEA